MGRRKGATGPGHRVYLTLTETQHHLLEDFAKEAGSAPATLGAEILTSILDSAVTEHGDTDREQIQATILTLRGDPTYPTNVPRWKRPLDAILLDTAWWRAWYPDLCALLGPDPRPASLGTGDGSFDLLDYLFSPVAGPRGTITWRSMDYPVAAEKQRRGEASGPLRPIWERVIRHVVVALTALEKAQDPSLLISVEGQIRYGWLSTLLSLIGETDRGNKLPAPRLPSKPLV